MLSRGVYFDKIWVARNQNFFQATSIRLKVVSVAVSKREHMVKKWWGVLTNRVMMKKR